MAFHSPRGNHGGSDSTHGRLITLGLEERKPRGFVSGVSAPLHGHMPACGSLRLRCPRTPPESLAHTWASQEAASCVQAQDTITPCLKLTVSLTTWLIGSTVGRELSTVLIQVPTILISKPHILNLKSESGEEKLPGALPWNREEESGDGVVYAHHRIRRRRARL